MSTISSQEIISIIKSEIENFDTQAATEQETGSVIWVGDGIAIVYGMEHAMYGEIVIFENGVRGMVQDIRKDEIGVILFGKPGKGGGLTPGGGGSTRYRGQEVSGCSHGNRHTGN